MHTLDIWSAIIWIFYLLFILCLVNVFNVLLIVHTSTRVLTHDTVLRLKVTIELSASFIFLLSIVFLCFQYEHIYSSFQEFLFILGGVCAILYVPIRFDASSKRAFFAMLGELAVLSVSVASFTISQCEYGTISCDDEEYDFFHGNWHFLNAVVVSIVFARVLVSCTSISNRLSKDDRDRRFVVVAHESLRSSLRARQTGEW